MRIRRYICIISALLTVSGPVLGQEDADSRYYRDDVVVGCYVEMCGSDAKRDDRLEELARELVDELKESRSADDEGEEP